MTTRVRAAGVEFDVADRIDGFWPEFWQAVQRGTWEPATIQALEQLDAGDLFVDVGAWIGPTSLPAAARGARVVAFEPDPVARAELLVNIEVSRLGDRITVHPFALADRTAAMNLTAPSGLGDSMGRITHDATRDRSAQVEAVDVRSLLVDFEGARLIKIDIEGGEYTLLPAMRPWLRQHRPDLMLSLHTYQFDPWLARLPRGPRGIARRTLAVALSARLAWLMNSYRNRYVATATGWARVNATSLARWIIAGGGGQELYLSADTPGFASR